MATPLTSIGTCCLNSIMSGMSNADRYWIVELNEKSALPSGGTYAPAEVPLLKFSPLSSTLYRILVMFAPTMLGLYTRTEYLSVKLEFVKSPNDWIVTFSTCGR